MEETLQATEWVHRGSMIVRRDCLDMNDPESWIMLWKKKFGTLCDFPWEEVFGRKPSTKELFDLGLTLCPCCGQSIKEAHE